MIEKRATTVQDTADVPAAVKVDVGCKKAFVSADGFTKANHDAYVISYVYYKEGTVELYFDGSSWGETKPDDPESGIYSIK